MKSSLEAGSFSRTFTRMPRVERRLEQNVVLLNCSETRRQVSVLLRCQFWRPEP